MAFSVEVMEPAAFDAWLAREAEPAAAPTEAAARRGAELFHDVGCGACHAIRGTPAAGVIGPDLTHLASRATLAAGTLPMIRDPLARWITHPQAVKPAASLPPFRAHGKSRVASLADFPAARH